MLDPALKRGPSQRPTSVFNIAYWWRIQFNDPKTGIPLPKINTKTVRDFIHRQVRLANLHCTKMPSTVLQTTSISSEYLPAAPWQPSVLPPADYPQMEYVHTPSTAGTKVLKERMDIVTPVPHTQSQAANPRPAPLPALGRCVGTKVETQATSTITRPVSTPSAAHVLPSTSKMDTLHRSDTPAVWARATLYKRKHKDQLTDVGGKLSRVHHLPFCTLCIQPTQGHKKYKQKSFSEVFESHNEG